MIDVLYSYFLNRVACLHELKDFQIIETNILLGVAKHPFINKEGGS